MRQLLLVLLAALLVSGCVSQRVVKGEQQPAQKFNAAEAAQVRLALGLEYLNSGEFEQAKFNLEKAYEYAPKSADVQLGLAYYYQRADNLVAATRHYEQALDLEPNNPDVMNNYGVLLCEAGQYEAADKLFQQALQVNTYFRVGDTYENAANCAYENGDITNAQQYFEQAINHAPQDSAILERYAGLLLQLERWSQAQDVLRKRARQPQLSAQYLWLEVQLSRALGNPERARQYGEILEQQYPDSTQTQRYQQPIKL